MSAHIIVFCQARLDRPDLPRRERRCGRQVTSLVTTVPHDADHARTFDFGTVYFVCGHAADKDNNALERDIAESYKAGHW